MSVHPIQIEAEEAVLSRLVPDAASAGEAPMIFVLGSPRTGSTRLYQAIVRFMRLPYFSNLANDAFPEQPILALAIQKEAQPAVEIQLAARYGKTIGAFQPSEASAIMTHWCGGGHPSALVSARVLPEQERHMARTIAGACRLFDAPLVIKNAWHCFRIANLARLFPNAHFIWVRRDIVASALSDLASRYVTRGDPNEWNSATPANIDDLQKLPYWVQVVENQYEFARSIRTGLAESAVGRHSIVWFEDFVREPRPVLMRIAEDLNSMISTRVPDEVALGAGEGSVKPFRPGDEENLRTYVRDHQLRLIECMYRR